MHAINLYINLLWISYVLFYFTFCCRFGIIVSLLIFSCVYYGTFCYQVCKLPPPLCIYIFDFIKFLLLIKWESSRGPVGGRGGPQFLGEEKKEKETRRERLKGRILSFHSPHILRYISPALEGPTKVICLVTSLFSSSCINISIKLQLLNFY